MTEPESIAPLQQELEHLYYMINEERFDEQKRLNEKLSEVDKKKIPLKKALCARGDEQGIF